MRAGKKFALSGLEFYRLETISIWKLIHSLHGNHISRCFPVCNWGNLSVRKDTNEYTNSYMNFIFMKFFESFCFDFLSAQNYNGNNGEILLFKLFQSSFQESLSIERKVPKTHTHEHTEITRHKVTLCVATTFRMLLTWLISKVKARGSCIHLHSKSITN